MEKTITPKGDVDFQSKTYWDTFFAKRGGVTFEWYGNYKTYRDIIRKEILPEQKVLVLGCGNSLFSEHMIDDGYKSITNVDYSEKVIAEMQARVMDRKGLKYELMDITNMTYADESFDVVFDKSTLDAMYPNEEQKSVELVEKMWLNAIKVLPNKGKYVCVTLFQSHLMFKIIGYFLEGRGNPYSADHAFVLKVYEVPNVEEKLVEEKHVPFVFVIEKMKMPAEKEVAAKLKSMLSSTVYYVSEKSEPITIGKMIGNVRNKQLFGYVMHNSKKFEKGQRFKIECYDTEKNPDVPRYTLAVVDSQSDKVLKNRTCGVFIAPLGRENDYLFATEEGNFYLQSDSKYTRLIIVTLNHLHKFDNIEQIKAELSPKIVPLLPDDCKNKDKVPFLKIGEDIGKRTTVIHEGGVIVEDVQDFDGSLIRRLFFEAKIEQIQSEVNLKRTEKAKETEPLEVKCDLYKEEAGKCVIVNHRVLCSDYARAIVAGLSAISHTVLSKPEFKITVLGTGAGSLSTFFRQNIPTSITNTVDCDKTILDVGQKFFGFKPDAKLISHFATAEDYMNTVFAKKEPNPYDLLVIDLNNPDLSTGISPGPQFYSKEFLQKVKESGSGSEVMVVINMIFRGNEARRNEAIEGFLGLFEVVFSIKLNKEINEVFFMITRAGVAATATANYSKVFLTSQIYALQKQLGVDWTKSMNTLDHIDSMAFYSSIVDKKEKHEEKKKKKKKKH